MRTAFRINGLILSNRIKKNISVKLEQYVYKWRIFKLKIRSIDYKPYLKNPFLILAVIWRGYNSWIDNSTDGIKDLGLLIKISILSLASLFLFPIFGWGVNSNGEIGDLLAGFYALVLIALVFLWFGYLPFLVVRLVIYYYKRLTKNK